MVYRSTHKIHDTRLLKGILYRLQENHRTMVTSFIHYRVRLEIDALLHMLSGFRGGELTLLIMKQGTLCVCCLNMKRVLSTYISTPSETPNS